MSDSGLNFLEFGAEFPLNEFTAFDNDNSLSFRICKECGEKITDKWILQCDLAWWHASCLRCSHCQTCLEFQDTCFSKDGRIYCKEDYRSIYGKKSCSRCEIAIRPTEPVFFAADEVYHVTCFSCETCNRTLQTGQQFGMFGTKVFCREHYEDEMKPKAEVSALPFFNGVGLTNKGRPRKRRNPLLDVEFASYESDTYASYAPRQKRVRTSFKTEQLNALKRYFESNKNPDSKDLKQLSQDIGLSKRVLQVWFQNARAKHRKLTTSSPATNYKNQKIPPKSRRRGSEVSSASSSSSGLIATTTLSLTEQIVNEEHHDELENEYTVLQEFFPDLPLESS